MNATSERDPENRDPEKLERTADQIRADMDRTLNALERKLSPSQLLDRSLEYLREHGSDMARTVGETVRSNPVPIVLAAAGIGWLVAASLRGRSSRHIDDTFGDESPYSQSQYGQSQYGQSQYGQSQYAQSQSTQTRSGSKLHQRFESARERIRSSRGATMASEKLSQASSVTRERARQAQDRMMSVMDEQPILIGSIAAAFGALLGALIPTTDYEDRTVGQLRDRAMERAKEAGERQYQNLRSKLETHQDVEVSGRAH
jgi:ElaB/YqjD/DUF883 family membrane-anchored ribosome-binding protein